MKHSLPFIYDRSNVRLYAADFPDLHPHSTGRRPPQAACSIEIHGGILDAGTPDRGFPVIDHTGVVITDLPLLQGWSCRTRLPSWSSTQQENGQSEKRKRSEIFRPEGVVPWYQIKSELCSNGRGLRKKCRKTQTLNLNHENHYNHYRKSDAQQPHRCYFPGLAEWTARNFQTQNLNFKCKVVTRSLRLHSNAAYSRNTAAQPPNVR